jgi:hypothetical protein
VTGVQTCALPILTIPMAWKAAICLLCQSNFINWKAEFHRFYEQLWLWVLSWDSSDKSTMLTWNDCQPGSQLWDICQTKGYEQRNWESYGIGSHYQVTTCEDTADCKDLVHAVVNCRVCELAIALQLFIVMICRCSTNAITNPNPVYSHSYTRQLVSEVVGLKLYSITLLPYYDDRTTDGKPAG